MLFGSLDIYLVDPVDAQCVEGAAASGSIASREVDAEGRAFIFRPCSGFLISRLHVLTADHCVQPNLVFDQTYLAASVGARSIEVVPFGWTVRLQVDREDVFDTCPAAALPALGDPLYRNQSLDFAVLALQQPVSSKFVDLAAVAAAEDGGPDGAELRMYAFPNGLPLSESSSCRSVPSPLEDILLHDCDTLVGSSGGLLVSASTGAGVAMQTESMGSNDVTHFQKYGEFESPCDSRVRICDPATGAPAQEPVCFEGGGYNVAVKLTSVARDIQRQAPLLWRSILDASRI